MRRLTIWSTLFAFAFGFSFSLQAETLTMPEQTEATETQTQEPVSGTYSVNLPGRGMSMTDVEARFGSPTTKMEEVGDPPITRWIYDDFTVFFEYQFAFYGRFY